MEIGMPVEEVDRPDREEDAVHHLGQDEIAELQRQVRAQAALIQRLQQRLQANGIDQSSEDGFFALSASDTKSLSTKPAEDCELDLKLMAEKDLKGFLERVVALTTDRQGADVLPKMEIRFKNLTVKSRQKKRAGIQTVAGYFMDCFTKCLQEKTDVTLLNNLSGVIKPGRLTLVLGPPGAGKSTFMKALSNKTKGSGVKVVGDITYNGERANTKKFVLKKMVGYVDQRDNHIPALTVHETLLMACRGMNGGRRMFESLLAGEPEKLEAVKQVLRPIGTKADVLIKVLGLEQCKDTVVGDDMLRGISGGQRKRVTLGEMMAGSFICLFLDEISTGLDSAAALDITKALRYATDIFQYSTVAALLQPAPEVYAQFDDIILFDSGNIVYHGAREEILSYFEELGFRCPPRKDVADYLQEVTTKDGAQYLMPEEELREKKIVPPKSTAEFVQRWQLTAQAKAMQQELEKTVADYPIPQEFQVEFAQTFLSSVALCANMFRILLRRDPTAVRVPIVQNIFLGSIMAIVFQGLALDQVQSKMGLIFMSLMNFALASVAQLPDDFARRSVFYKQRDANFYYTLAYSIARNLVSLPVSIVKVAIFCSIVYWSADLSGDNGGLHYGFFLLVCVLVDLAMGQFFKVLMAAMPSYHAAVPVGAVSILFMVIFSGFIVAPEEIPSYWLWIYYVNPLAYAFTALIQNELKSDSYSAITASGKEQGDTYLESYGFKTDARWMVTGCIYLAAFYGLMLTLSTFLLHNLRLRPVQGGGVAADIEDEDATGAAVVDEEVASGTGGQGVTFNIKSSALPVQECSLAWNHLSYAVDMPAKKGSKKQERLELLHDISGCCLPGTMTALMGASGAGKTTLLDVLAGRKTSGYTSGEMFMNGFPLDRLSFRRISGYVEQTDIHTPTSTVEESFHFSARLRLPSSVSNAQIARFVKETLKTLELDVDAGKLVGGLSVEQAKRVTIGVELVANPSIIFLDEPTSGLDARAAMLIVKVIRRLASTGRTIICTIHQPSSSIFESFDSLLLLKRGGRTVFFGELGRESAKLIDYLQAIPATRPISAGANPAAWMLDVIGAGTTGGSAVDFAYYYESSNLKLEAEAKLASAGVTKPGSAPKIMFKDSFASTIGMQMRQCMKKAFRNYWRTPSYNAVRFIIGSVVAFLFGSVYWQYDPEDYAQANSLVAVVYITTMFMGIICTMSVLPVMGTERAVFYRERASNMYLARIYGIGVGVAEVPYVFATCTLFMGIFYWTVGLRSELGPFLWYYLFFQLYVFQAVFLGQFLVCILPNQQVAQIITALSSNIFGLFAGYMQPPQDIPEGVVLFHWVNPLAYAFKGLIVTQFHNDDTEVTVVLPDAPEPRTITMDHFVFKIRFTEMEYDDRWVCLGALLGFILLWRVGTMLALTYVNHLKR